MENYQFTMTNLNQSLEYFIEIFFQFENVIIYQSSSKHTLKYRKSSRGLLIDDLPFKINSVKMVKVNGKLGIQIFYNVFKDIEGILSYILLIKYPHSRNYLQIMTFEPISGKNNHTFINVEPKLEYEVSLIQDPGKRNFYRKDSRFITSPEYF
ncbi:unnamed protein product [Gordionus sp. m RMFG-2023]